MERLQKVIEKMEKAGRHGIASLLRNWSRVVQAREEGEIQAYDVIRGFGTLKDMAKRVAFMSVSDLEQRALSVAAFHYPEVKGELLTDG